VAPLFSFTISLFLSPIGPISSLKSLSVQSETKLLFIVLANVPPFVAGLAILSMRSWSYKTFLACMTLMTALNVYQKIQYPRYFSWGMLVVFTLINLGVVSFFLLREMRAPYFDPKLRWWEVKPRFRGDLLTVKIGGLKMENAVVADISQSGMLLVANSSFEMGSLLKIALEFQNTHAMIQGRVVRFDQKEGRMAYGLRFENVGSENARVLKSFLNGLETEGLVFRKAVSWWEDLRGWISAPNPLARKTQNDPKQETTQNKKAA